MLFETPLFENQLFKSRWFQITVVGKNLFLRRLFCKRLFKLSTATLTIHLFSSTLASMTDQRFHYPFSAYVTGILTYAQLVDALKSYLADYPQQLAHCAKQNIALLRTEKISELQYHTLQTVLNTLPPLNSLITEQPAYSSSPIPATNQLDPLITSNTDNVISTTLIPSPTDASNPNQNQQPTPITANSTMRMAARASADTRKNKFAKKKPALLEKHPATPAGARQSRKTSLYGIGFVGFVTGCFSGYLGHAYNPDIAKQIAQQMNSWQQQSANLAPKPTVQLHSQTQVQTQAQSITAPVASKPQPVQAEQPAQTENRPTEALPNTDPADQTITLSNQLEADSTVNLNDSPPPNSAIVHKTEQELIEALSNTGLVADLNNPDTVSPLQTTNPAIQSNTQNSEQQNLQAIQALLPAFIDQPLTHLAAMQDLLATLNTPKHLNTPVVQQARHAMAQAYLQMARTARQQQDWQQAELFLQQSIAVRIDPVQTK